MKNKFLLGLALAATLGSAQAADVGVSIGISQPGVYGRIDIGRFPQPQVIVSQPVWIERPRYERYRPEPVYLWVPPGHQKNWRKHCYRYGACGTPVYFVEDRWYRSHVMAGQPRGYRERDAYREVYRDGYRDGYRQGDRDDDYDRGRGRGHGRDKYRD